MKKNCHITGVAPSQKWKVVEDLELGLGKQRRVEHVRATLAGSGD